MYKFVKNFLTEGNANMILRTEDNTFIPFDPANSDYQQYLVWLEEGNTPEAAE